MLSRVLRFVSAQESDRFMQGDINNDGYTQRDKHEEASLVEDVLESHNGRE